MELSRNYARWELAEDNMLLQSHKQGKWIYQIAKEHRRSQNAIQMRLNLILPPKNYIPVYNPIKLVLQPKDVDFPIQSKTQQDMDVELILRLRDSGMSWEDIQKLNTDNPTPKSVPIVSGWFSNVFKKIDNEFTNPDSHLRNFFK